MKVFPKPAALRIIKNKIEQKKFYQHHQIPTSEFVITENKEELQALVSFLPAAHKVGMGGYDGRGVEILKTAADLERGFDAPSVLEKLVPIQKEIAMIVAVGQDGEITMYPPAEMIFDQNLNLLDYQVSPAELPDKIFWKVEAIAMAVVRNLESPGLFAVELFVDKNEEVLVNETAPRVHNSGHHTIEANFTSQFEQHFRAVMGMPLGNTDTRCPAAMVNLLGEEGYTGDAYVEGMDEALSQKGVYVHLYGKKTTKPFRKMGHVTILDNEVEKLKKRALHIKEMIKVKA